MLLVVILMVLLMGVLSVGHVVLLDVILMVLLIGVLPVGHGVLLLPVGHIVLLDVIMMVPLMVVLLVGHGAASCDSAGPIDGGFTCGSRSAVYVILLLLLIWCYLWVCW